ncbi:MAG TPA: hypothetical protein PLC61_05935, partial [Chitinophagales bacterium]|nr:hypothetical protein [Chitinophagales bacterium]
IFIEGFSNPSTIRQNLQGEYINRLLNIIDEKSGNTYSVKSAVYGQIDRVKKLLEVSASSGSLAVNAHRQNLLYLINNKLSIKN